MNLVKRAKILWCLLPFFYAPVIHASQNQSAFVFSQNCIDAQKNIKVLKLDKAKIILELERKINPNNVAVDYLEDFIDFYYLITNQEIEELHKLEPAKNIRLNRIKNSDPNSPYFLYTQAEINLHWAFARVLNNEFVNAVFEFRAAYQLLKINDKKFPHFLPNKKSLGMLQAVLGTVPESYKWILNVIGMSGDLNDGMKNIKDFLDQKEPRPEFLLEKQSAEFYYNFLLLNFGDKKDCWKFCETVTADYEINLFSTYIRAFTAIKCAQNDQAIYAIAHSPKGNDYVKLEIMDYLMGKAKLNRLDKDADVYFKKFVTFYKGQNLVKDAYKRLSWYSLLEGDTLKYSVYTGLARKYGATTSDEDKNALKESEMGILPDIILLKARLLFDGGYYSIAEDVIRMHQKKFRTENQQIEYYYRYARIMHGSNKIASAIELYTKTISASENSTLYFAPNSCIQLGYIYEKLGYKELAKNYFEKALVYKNYDYKSGISQEAKAGLSRLN